MLKRIPEPFGYFLHLKIKDGHLFEALGISIVGYVNYTTLDTPSSAKVNQRVQLSGYMGVTVYTVLAPSQVLKGSG